ncbi:MAG: hypothetical protein AB7O52_17995 [Planctomycetota bacterium]
MDYAVGGLRASSLSLVLALAMGCAGGPDLAEWRDRIAGPRVPMERASLEQDQAQVSALRDAGDLVASRRLALALAAEQPYDARSLFLASRAESDGVFLYPADDRESRDTAALSALEFAQRAADAGGADAETLGQLAWATGTTTHLQAMFSRAGHARRTLAHADAALALDPNQVTALATKATLRLRLATLPWIARVMAFGAPEGSIDEAIELAQRCVVLEPSLELELLLAKALTAAARSNEACQALETALARPHRYPRDVAIRPQATAFCEPLADPANGP